MADKTVALTVLMGADASDVTQAFDSVGDSAKDMATAVTGAASDADTAAGRLGGVADAAGNVDSKAAAATGALGALSSGFELVGLDGFAGGLQKVAMATDFVSGAGQALNLVLGLESVQHLKAAATTAAHTAATTTASVATKAYAAGQAVLNAVLSANPIALVVIAIAALVAGVILAYKNSETFRTIVQTAMAGAKAAIGTVVDVVTDLVGYVKDKALTVWPLFSAAISVAKDLVVGYFNTIIGPIQTVIDKVQDLIGFIKNIGDFKLPSIPGLGRVSVEAVNGRADTRAAQVASLQSGAAYADGGSSGGITLVRLEAINPRDLAQDLRRLGYRVGGSS